jgi:hypothetical protein
MRTDVACEVLSTMIATVSSAALFLALILPVRATAE